MNDIDPTRVGTLDELAACLRRLHIQADKPPYRMLEQQTVHENGPLPGTPRLRRVRLGRSTISDMLAGRKFPGKAFLLTFVEACGVDVAADRRWAEAWDRLSEQYAKRTGQDQTELAQLREEVAGLHTEVAAEQCAAKKAQAEGANLRAQLAAATQNAEKAQLEALHQLERTQRQLSDAQNEVTRLRKEVKDLTEKLEAQQREAARSRDLAPAAADSPDYRADPGSSGYGPRRPGAPGWRADSAEPAYAEPAYAEPAYAEPAIPAAEAEPAIPVASEYRAVPSATPGYGSSGYGSSEYGAGRPGAPRRAGSAEPRYQAEAVPQAEPEYQAEPGYPAAVASARAGVGVAPPDIYDPERIRAALRGDHARSEQAASGYPAAPGYGLSGYGAPSSGYGAGRPSAPGRRADSAEPAYADAEPAYAEPTILVAEAVPQAASEYHAVPVIPEAQRPGPTG